ncbi:MAG TPA: magnesium transporter [Acidimicrobiia bacterium]|jgi:magnesium transporter|nr:magnesium transporter [Acidimicrobiia bacterium]
MKIPFQRVLIAGLRDLARRRPEDAEEYIDAHQEEWEALVEDDPHDAADILEALNSRSAAQLIADLDIEDVGDVLDEMRPEAAADLMEELTPEQAAILVGEMDADQAADLIDALDDDARQAVLGQLEPLAAAEIGRLLGYAPDSAGGMMTTELAALPVGLTAGEAIEALRRLHDDLGSNLTYVYVVDEERRLVGVVPFRELVFARPGQSLEEVMVHDPYHVPVDADREVVTELMQRYHLLAMPVVDQNRALLGMVKVVEAIGAIQEEAGEDIAVMVGAGEEEGVYTPVMVSVRRRLPWIMVNLAIAAVIAIVIAQFEDIIAREAILAALMPMVALLGGNSGAQSLAVMIRSMAVGDLPPGRAGRAIRREGTVALFNAAAMSIASALLVGAGTGDQDLAIIVGVAVAVNLVVAGIAGASIPVVLRRLGQDPALASNIFLTTVTDIVGFGGFLLTAVILL